jgi:hypothetical protein
MNIFLLKNLHNYVNIEENEKDPIGLYSRHGHFDQPGKKFSFLRLLHPHSYI